MPTFKLNGKRLVYFSAWKNHIDFDSIHEGNEAFRKELSPYEGEKGSLRFPLEKPIPYDLVKKIVMVRMKEIQYENNYQNFLQPDWKRRQICRLRDSSISTGEV